MRTDLTCPTSSDQGAATLPAPSNTSTTTTSNDANDNSNVDGIPPLSLGEGYDESSSGDV